MRNYNLDCIFFISLVVFIVGIFIPISVCAENVTMTPVTTPFITIDPIGNHTVGDVFFINGTTNLPVTEKLNIDVYPFHSVMEQRGYKPRGIAIDDIPIISSTTNVNYWSANVTDGYWKPDEYIAEIFTTKSTTIISGYQIFTIVSAKTDIISNNTSSLSSPPTLSPSIQPTTSSNLTGPNLKAASFPLITVFAILIGIVFAFANGKKIE